MRALVRLGATFEGAVDAATRVPARAARRDDALEVTAVYVGGEALFAA